METINDLATGRRRSRIASMLRSVLLSDAIASFSVAGPDMIFRNKFLPPRRSGETAANVSRKL
jgi:hypothetical protein